MANLHEESAVSFLPCRTWVITGGGGVYRVPLGKSISGPGQSAKSPYAADISKIWALGFEPKVSLQDALAEMWAQLKNQAE